MRQVSLGMIIPGSDLLIMLEEPYITNALHLFIPEVIRKHSATTHPNSSPCLRSTPHFFCLLLCSNTYTIIKLSCNQTPQPIQSRWIMPAFGAKFNVFTNRLLVDFSYRSLPRSPMLACYSRLLDFSYNVQTISL